MKEITVGVFATRPDAERAINNIHNNLKIDNDEISYVYRNTEGELKEVDANDVSTDTPMEGAKTGAGIGGALGALAGIAAIAGVIPVAGPIFAAGPIAAALGLTGAVGVTAAGAAGGAAAGGIVGALVNIGVGREHAQKYADRVEAGDIIVSVHHDENTDVASEMNNQGATEVNVYTLS